jgi:hypothetical protein
MVRTSNQYSPKSNFFFVFCPLHERAYPRTIAHGQVEPALKSRGRRIHHLVFLVTLMLNIFSYLINDRFYTFADL